MPSTPILTGIILSAAASVAELWRNVVQLIEHAWQSVVQHAGHNVSVYLFWVPRKELTEIL